MGTIRERSCDKQKKEHRRQYYGRRRINQLDSGFERSGCSYAEPDAFFHRQVVRLGDDQNVGP